MGCAVFILWITTLVMLFVAAVTVQSAYREEQALARLRQSGVPVDGQVTSKKVRSTDPRVGAAFSVDFHYKYGGHGYTRTLPVSRSMYKNWDIGTSVQLVCLPDDPETATLAETVYSDPATTRIKNVLLAGLMVICGLGLVAVSIYATIALKVL